MATGTLPPKTGTARPARPASAATRPATTPARTRPPKSQSTKTAAKTATRSTVNRASKAGSQVANVAAGQSRKVAGQAKEQARDVAATAADRGGALVEVAKQDARQLAGTVKARASEVTGELTTQTRSLAQETRAQLEGQAQTGALRLALALHDFGGQAQALAEGRPEDAPTLSDYVFRVADGAYNAADRLHYLADDVEARGFSGVLDDLQGFARRRPGAFLLGAAAVGFGIGRLVKASKADQDDDEDGPTYAGNGRAAGQVARQPLAVPARTGR